MSVKKSKPSSFLFNLIFLGATLVVFVVTAITFAGWPASMSKIMAAPFVQNIRNVIAFGDYPPVPVFVGETALDLNSTVAFAMDLDSEVVLYAKNETLAMLPASTVKIMTALVSVDVFSPDLVVEVKNPFITGQKMGLQVGEKITVENLLNGLLIYSANDAAEVLAQSYPGGRDAFIELMNQKAKDMGLVNTHFTNSSGVDQSNQYTTARDMAYLGFGAIKDSRLSKIVSTKEKTIKSVDDTISHHLLSTNLLLGEVPGVLGIKTGWTEYARENLVTYITRDGHRVIIAILGSQDRFGETKKIIDWVFSSYAWEPITSFL